MLKLGTVLIDCYNSGYGNQIETKYARELLSLIHHIDWCHGWLSIINHLQRLVPWGDAYANKSNNSTASCQNKHLALIYCIEFLAIEGRQKEWETCFSSLGLPKKDILDSYNSSNATKLEQNYGNEIMHLNPPLEFVPWLVLNNQPIGNDYENFAGYVCKAYKCKIVPMACQSVHLKQKTELTHSTQAINQPESSLSPGPLIQPKSTFYQQIRLHNSTNCGS